LSSPPPQEIKVKATTPNVASLLVTPRAISGECISSYGGEASRFGVVDVETIRSDLAGRRDELAEELARLTTPPEQGVGVGFGKRVGDGTTEAVERIATTAMARSIAASISEIDNALVRIADGSYGLCEVCNQSISEVRLAARPATVRCVACASGGQE
jgi:RNA polymerase-binding transcription factor DksA